MKTFKYKDLDVTEYEVIRSTQYMKEKTTFNAPSDMVFYEICGTEYEITFEGEKYTPKTWIGITSYSEAKEKISHNMHYDICGEKDDYPCVNTFGVTVHNLAGKYLIWQLNNIDEYDELPKSDNPIVLPEPFYLMKASKTENDEILRAVLEGQIDSKDIDWDREFYKPYKFIKIHGLSQNMNKVDCTVITIGSWLKNNDEKFNIISREDMEFDEVSLGYERHNKTCISSQKEFETEYLKAIEKFGVNIEN